MIILDYGNLFKINKIFMQKLEINVMNHKLMITKFKQTSNYQKMNMNKVMI